MNPHQFLLILLARYKVALLTMLAVVVIAQAASFLLPKQYTATTALVVDVRSPDPVAAMFLPCPDMATQVEIINSDRVAQRVVKDLKLDENPTVKAAMAGEHRRQGQAGCVAGGAPEEKAHGSAFARQHHHLHLLSRQPIRTSRRPLPMPSPKPISTPPSS